MKNLVFEFSKIVTLLATIGVGALSLGPGWSVFMDDGAQAAYFLERKRDRLDKACRATPDSIALHGELATVCEELGLWSDAFRCREKLIALEPASAKRYRDFADSLSAMRSDGLQYFGCRREEIPERVIALYQAAVMRAPRDESLAREFAMTFYSLGGGFETKPSPHGDIRLKSPPASRPAKRRICTWRAGCPGPKGSPRRDGICNRPKVLETTCWSGKPDAFLQP